MCERLKEYNQRNAGLFHNVSLPSTSWDTILSVGNKNHFIQGLRNGTWISNVCLDTHFTSNCEVSVFVGFHFLFKADSPAPGGSVLKSEPLNVTP